MASASTFRVLADAISCKKVLADAKSCSISYWLTRYPAATWKRGGSKVLAGAISCNDLRMRGAGCGVRGEERAALGIFRVLEHAGRMWHAAFGIFGALEHAGARQRCPIASCTVRCVATASPAPPSIREAPARNAAAPGRREGRRALRARPTRCKPGNPADTE